MSISKADDQVGGLVAVVIPCYRVTDHILGVLADIGPEVDSIYCIDDACPANSGDFIERQVSDPRVKVLRHDVNKGVGGAVMTGYRQAIADDMHIVVKIDGDGQMDPRLVPVFIKPIRDGAADYTKGNRFWDLREIKQMPLLRRVGNLGLSFMAKASTGYWDIFDPTNGYTAIHVRVAENLPFDSIGRRYFFETDMLFRLNITRAVVMDIPMDARYGDEISGLKVSSVIFEFTLKHCRNFGKRIIYNYFLRDLSLASLELVAAIMLLAFAVFYGGWHWVQSIQQEVGAPLGTVMIATVAVVSGLQFLLAFLGYDIASIPRRPIAGLLANRRFRKFNLGVRNE